MVIVTIWMYRCREGPACCVSCEAVPKWHRLHRLMWRARPLWTLARAAGGDDSARPSMLMYLHYLYLNIRQDEKSIESARVHCAGNRRVIGSICCASNTSI